MKLRFMKVGIYATLVPKSHIQYMFVFPDAMFDVILIYVPKHPHIIYT